VEYINWSNAGALSMSTALWSQTMKILSALRYTNWNISDTLLNSQKRKKKVTEVKLDTDIIIIIIMLE